MACFLKWVASKLMLLKGTREQLKISTRSINFLKYVKINVEQSKGNSFQRHSSHFNTFWLYKSFILLKSCKTGIKIIFKSCPTGFQ